MIRLAGIAVIGKWFSRISGPYECRLWLGEISAERTYWPVYILGLLSVGACGLVESGRHRDEMEVCVGIACESENERVCIEGEMRCEDGATLAICDSAGDWNLIPCPADTNGCANAQCEPRDCEPLERRCVEWEVHQCRTDGMGWEFVETCVGDCFGGVCLDPCGHHTDKVSYLGCTFWAVNLENRSQEAQDDFAITVSSDAHLPIEVVVTTAVGLEVERVEIEPGNLVTIPLTTLGQLDGTGFSEQSYLIESTGRVTVHQFNPINDIDIHSSDASLLLPLEGLGTEYRVIGWPTEFVYVNMSQSCSRDEDCLFEHQVCDDGQCEGPAVVGRAQVSIVGTSVSGTTSLTIQSPVEIEVAAQNGASVFYPAETSHEFVLERGQVLTVATTVSAEADLSGLSISADHEVAVFSGSTCAMIPHGAFACDHLEQQLFPIVVWGDEYVGAKFYPRGIEPDIWRVLATHDDTLLSTLPAMANVDGVVLNAGQVLQFESTTSFELRGSKPMSVSQYMVSADYPGPAGGCSSPGAFPAPSSDRTSCAIDMSESCDGHQAIGDPAFLMSVPTAQFRTRYVVLVPGDYVENYFSFIVRNGAEIRLNGALVAVSTGPIAGSDWIVFAKEVMPGVHVVEASEPIGLNSYGYDCTVSYAYPGGLNLERLER